MASAIIAAVILWFVRSIVTVVIVLGCAGIAFLIGRGKEGVTIVGFIIGWILGVIWEIWAIVQVIINIVEAIQIAVG